MANGSFVFGMDGDGPDVFDRTVDWAVSQGIETATFHILTPYPSTALYQRMAAEKFEPFWDTLIRLKRVTGMLPALEQILTSFGARQKPSPAPRPPHRKIQPLPLLTEDASAETASLP